MKKDELLNLTPGELKKRFESVTDTLKGIVYKDQTMDFYILTGELNTIKRIYSKQEETAKQPKQLNLKF